LPPVTTCSPEAPLCHPIRAIWGQICARREYWLSCRHGAYPLFQPRAPLLPLAPIRISPASRMPPPMHFGAAQSSPGAPRSPLSHPFPIRSDHSAITRPANGCDDVRDGRPGPIPRSIDRESAEFQSIDARSTRISALAFTSAMFPNWRVHDSGGSVKIILTFRLNRA
jgi:hypothetical protein